MNETMLELEGDREIVMSRTFNAPARIVFDAWTKPELVMQWWAPKSHDVRMVRCDADVRVGGTYRYVIQKSGGPEIAFSGVYSEVTPPTRLRYTQIFEPMRETGEVIVTITFAEQGGKTHLVSRSLCPSKQVRDGMLASGMEHGARETFEQLETLLASLAGR